MSKKIQYNTARLLIMKAKAVIAGGKGPLFTSDEVILILEDARSALTSCYFWLPKGKYDMYYQTLKELERQVGVVISDKVNKEERKNDVPLSLSRENNEAPPPAPPAQLPRIAAKRGKPTYLKEYNVVCAHCKGKSAETAKCAGCCVTPYCCKKCQREAWPDHKVECRKLQDKKKNKVAAK